MPSNFKQTGNSLESYLIETTYKDYVPVAYRKQGGLWGSWGAAWSWGNNNFGSPGLGTSGTTRISSPTQIGTLTDWNLISTGKYHALAIKTDGSLWTWGSNGSGQLGNGNITPRSSPVQVGTLTDWKLVNGGFYDTSHAIKTDGTLWAWGNNAYGQLGLNNTTNRSSPVQVGTLTNWSSPGEGGYTFNGAIKTDGTLWSWGANNYGQLGQGNRTSYSSPVQIGNLTNWSLLSCGSYYHMAAIKTDGTLWAWGGNESGQLGLGNRTNYSSPVQVGALTDWKYVKIGASFTVATKTDGTLWAWGRGDYGQLGHNNTTSKSSPVQVGALTTWNLIYASNHQVFAIKTDGTLWAWGNNQTNYMLGQGDTISKSSPVQIGNLTTWKKMGTGASQFYCIGIKT